jgi:hypothetical protein
MLRNSSVVTFFLAISVSLSAAAAVPSANIRMVAAVGQSAPGTTNSFGTFIGSPPSVNIQGDVAFRAGLTGGEGIWAERGAAGLQVVAVNNQNAPGVPGKKFQFFGPSNPSGNTAVGSLIFNNNGQILFRATFAGSTSVFNNDGLWLADPVTGIEFIAKSGGTLPGSGRQVVQIESSNSALNDNADVAFRGRYTTSFTTEAGLWAYSGPATTHLVAQGTTSTFTTVAFDGAVLDGSGRTYFKADLGGSVTGVYGESAPGTLQLIAKDGQTAPGISPSATFDGVYPFDMAVNSSGTVAFASSLSNGKNALFTGSLSGPVTPKVVSGTLAPGAPSGAVFSSFYSPEINAQGRLAFKAEISGTGITSGNNQGIWLENAAGGFDLVAREGTTIPGGTGSVVFGSEFPDVFPEIVLNALGQIAFKASTVSSSATGQGVWATGINGVLHQVVWSGQPFDTVANGTKSHSLFSFAGNTGNDEGLPSGFSDSGYVSFRGSSGASTEAIYVSSVVAVPEPSSAVLIAIIIGAIATRSSRSVRPYVVSTMPRYDAIGAANAG